MITSTYFIIYIYFAELWPTLLRNFSVGIAVFHSRIGGILAPYLIYAGEYFSIDIICLGSEEINYF